MALPFWIQFGLVVALGSSALLNQHPGTAQADARVPSRTGSAVVAAAILAGVLVVVSVPMGARRGRVEPPVSQAVDGFFAWETGADGIRFRWTGDYASVFVPADVRRVEIPVRAPMEEHSRAKMGVELSLDAVYRFRYIARDAWTTIAVDLPPPAAPVSFIGSISRWTARDSRRSWWPEAPTCDRSRSTWAKYECSGRSRSERRGRTTYNAELAEDAEKPWLCVLRGLCVDRRGERVVKS